MESPKSRIGHVADELYHGCSCGKHFVVIVLVNTVVVAVAVVVAGIPLFGASCWWLYPRK